ncbi:TetR/AcrR family transcriptional regulator [Catalinimonas niigatensis]|uniref:TetR/AcrR family transcriptional regulator n=1 Tax=Catalinimonas niigatensis TaxID=1397264 RepID=UPI00266662EB|nr:TetR/AcrR family transcriptional regulator [Catalinimonas niigatensis]WPP49224.1 TetR/AcrR family transcriptional regulator [Catalinimonas niigatensis]
MDKRTEIISQALPLFASYGYEGVSVQQIVQAAGVTKPTLYYYFESKRGLLDVILEQYFDELYAATQQGAVYEGDLTITLRSIARNYFEYAEANKQFYRMQLTLWFSPPHSEAYSAVSPYYEKQYQHIERVFVKAAEQHGNMKDRHQDYTTTFLGILNTYIGLILNENKQPHEDLVYRVVHQFMHGILS